MSGKDIKALIVSSGCKLWQVAEKLGMNDGNFSRRLRRDFDEAEVEKVNEAIKSLKEKNS